MKKDRKQTENLAAVYTRGHSKERGITLIALVVTMVLHYDKVKKCSNSNSFLLSSI